MTASSGAGKGGVSSKEELTAALMAPAPSSNSKRAGANASTSSSTSSSSSASSSSASPSADISSASTSSSASSTALSSSRHSRPWPFERTRSTSSSSSTQLTSSSSSSAGKKPAAKLNKNGCLPGCSTFPRCSCRLKSTLKEKLKSKFDLAGFFQLTKESELLSGVRLLADLVEDGKVPLNDCIDRKVMEKLTTLLTVPALQAAALETLGVLLYVWLRVTKASTKKAKGGGAATAGGVKEAAAKETTATAAGSTAVVQHQHKPGQPNCSVCPACLTTGTSGNSSGSAAPPLPATSTLPPLPLDDWLCTPAATALISHTLPLLRPLATRHMASYILLHFCDGGRAALTLIHTPHAIPVLLDVYASLTDSKDTSMLLELSSIITGVCIKPTPHTLPILQPIAPVLLSKFRQHSNPLMTAYICKALGRLCDGQKEIAELVLAANISAYLLFLYWNAVDVERSKHSSSATIAQQHHNADVDDAPLFEDIFGLLGLLAFYERPHQQKLLAPLPTYTAATPFSLTSPSPSEKEQKAKEEEKLRSITWTGPKRTDAEVHSEQERLVQSYMKAQSAPDLVDIISTVMDLVVPPTDAPTTSTPLSPSSTDWYYVQCAAWQISMILTNGMAVRDSQHRRQRLINASVFKKILRCIDLYAASMPSACLCALSQALSYSVLGASSAQIGYLVCEGILHTLLLVVQHPKTSRKCLLCVLHAMNAILSMGERDRVPGRKGGDLWGEDEEEDEHDDEDVWAEEEEDELALHESSEDEYVIPESEKRRKGEGEADERKRGIRRRRKRERPGDKWDTEDSDTHREAVTTTRTNRPRSQQHQQQQATGARWEGAAADAHPATGHPTASCPGPSSCTASSSSASSSSPCAHCNGTPASCDTPPAYSATPTSPPSAAPHNGYVVLLRMLHGIDSILSRLELTTSKRTSKEDQSLLSLIRKLLSYFHHTPDLRVNNSLWQRRDQRAIEEANAREDHPTPPPPPTHPLPPPTDWLSDVGGHAAAEAGEGSAAFRRRALSPASRKRARWKAKQADDAARLQFDKKRRELRFLLTGVRGELPPGLLKPLKKTKEAVKDIPQPPPAKPAPAPGKKPSIEDLLRQMQEKERLRNEAEEKRKELSRERKAKAEPAVKEQVERPSSASASTASITLEEGESESDEEASPTSAAGLDDGKARLKERRAKKKAKAKAKKKGQAAASDKAGAKAAAKGKSAERVDYRAIVEEGVEVDGDPIEKMREERRREQDEVERKRVEMGIATAAQERALQVEEERRVKALADEAKRAEAERLLQAERDRLQAKAKREKELQREVEEKAKRLLRQAEEERVRFAQEVEQAKAKEREAARRAEAEKEKAELERAREEDKKAQAAAAAVAFASRPIHPCRFALCPLDGRISPSHFYVRLVCTAHCHIFFHHSNPSSPLSPSSSPSCWDLVPSSPSSPFSLPLSTTVAASSPCPTPDCDGTILSLTLLHHKDEPISTLIRPPPPRPPRPPPESKRERRARKRDEERRRYEAEEKKEGTPPPLLPDPSSLKVKGGGGFEVLVPAKEKDFSPVIPRPSFFSPPGLADESKERAPPTSPPSAAPAALAHVVAKRGRQARKTRIDIYLPEAEEEVEEEEGEGEETVAPLLPHLHPVEVSGAAYGGVVRTVTDGSSTSLLYLRPLTADGGGGEEESQWMINLCAMVAPIYVTRLFAPTAVVVKFDSAQLAEAAYAALQGRLLVQFAADPCSIANGAEADSIAAYHNLLVQKARNGGGSHSAPSFPGPEPSFTSFPATEETAQEEGEDEGGQGYADVVAVPPPPSRAGVEGTEGEVEELDAENFDFSFLAIGGEEDSPHPTHSASVSPSPAPPVRPDPVVATPSHSFSSSFTPWIASSSSDSTSAWSSPAAHLPSLSGMSSVFSPMTLAQTSPAQKEGKGAGLTPALDPILSPSLSSSLAFPSADISRAAANSTASSSFFSSSSLFSPSSSSPSSSSSSLFQSSFYMFSSISSSTLPDTTSASSSSSSTTTLAPSSSSFFSSSSSSISAPPPPSHPPLTRPAPHLHHLADASDDEFDVWNDEKLSSLVLKSDGDDDDDPALHPIPTHPRHDSIDQSTTDSHDTRDDADSLSQPRPPYDADDPRDYSQPSSPRSTQTATPPLPYPTRGYDSHSPQQQPQPRFTRPWYPPQGVAVPGMGAAPMYNAPGAVPHEVYGGGGGYGGWGGGVGGAAIPAYAAAGYPYTAGVGYGQAGYAAMGAGGWYPGAYPGTAAYMQMQMGMAVPVPYMQQMAAGGRPSPGYGPLRRPGQKLPGSLPSHMPPGVMNGDYYRMQSAAGGASPVRPEEVDERMSNGGLGKDRPRGKKGFVVDLEADFPSLAPTPGGLSVPSPSSASAAAVGVASPPSSVHSLAGSAAVHQQPAPAPSSAAHVSAPPSPHSETPTSSSESSTWTGHLATRLSRGTSSTSSSPSSAAAAPVLPSPHQAPSLSQPHSALPSQGVDGAGRSGKQALPQGQGQAQGQGQIAGQWRQQQPQLPGKEQSRAAHHDGGRSKKEGKGGGEKGGDRRRSTGKPNGEALQGPTADKQSRGGALGGGGGSGSSEWTEVAKKKRK